MISLLPTQLVNRVLFTLTALRKLSLEYLITTVLQFFHEAFICFVKISVIVFRNIVKVLIFQFSARLHDTEGWLYGCVPFCLCMSVLAWSLRWRRTLAERLSQSCGSSMPGSPNFSPTDIIISMKTTGHHGYETRNIENSLFLINLNSPDSLHLEN